jgi:hypothetical protein
VTDDVASESAGRPGRLERGWCDRCDAVRVTPLSTVDQGISHREAELGGLEASNS